MYKRQVKEEAKALFTEEEYAENADLAGLVGKYFYKTNKEACLLYTSDAADDQINV